MFSTVKGKLSLITLSTIFSLLIMASLLYYSTSQVSDIEYNRVQVAQIKAGVLMQRRNEKDFIMRRDMKYLDEFNNNMEILLTNTSDLIDGLERIEIDTLSVRDLMDILKEYQKLFRQLVQTQERVGLDEKSGLQGSLRKAVKTAEAQIKSFENDTLVSAMLMLRRNEKDFLLRINLKYQDEFNKNYSVFENTLQQSTIAPSSQAEMMRLMAVYQKDFHAMVNGYVELGLNSKEGVQGEMRSTVHQTETLLNDLAEKLDIEVKNNSMSAMTMAVMLALILAGMIGLAVSLISRYIISSLNHVITHMEEIAQGDGDLTVRLKSDGADELSALGKAFNLFVEKIANLISDVSDMAQKVSSNAEESSVNLEQTSANVIQQQTETDQIAAAINEMSATVQEVANNASQAAKAAHHADEEAKNGLSVINKNAKSIGKLAEEVGNATQVINKLKEDSENIGGILDVIRGIADQTNLLALNAAIEAARAGEQGRGFAVVADEVRSLAARTQDSTQEIQEMIEKLQQGANSAVEVMDANKERAETSSDRAASAGNSLHEIASTVSTINDMNTQIASASEQQAAVTEEINRSIVTIVQLSNETSHSSKQAATSSKDLAHLADSLQKLISQFKT